MHLLVHVLPPTFEHLVKPDRQEPTLFTVLHIETALLHSVVEESGIEQDANPLEHIRVVRPHEGVLGSGILNLLVKIDGPPNEAEHSKISVEEVDNQAVVFIRCADLLLDLYHRLLPQVRMNPL